MTHASIWALADAYQRLQCSFLSLPASVLVFTGALRLSLSPCLRRRYTASTANDSQAEAGHLCINLGFFIDPTAQHPPLQPTHPHTLPHTCHPYIYTWPSTIWCSLSMPSEQTKCLDEIPAAVSGNPNSFQMACRISLKAKAHLWHSSGGFGRSNCSGNKPFRGDKWALSVLCCCIWTPQDSRFINHSWIWLKATG